MDRIAEIVHLKVGIVEVKDRIKSHGAAITRLQVLGMNMTKELADLEEEVLTTEKSGKDRKK